MGKGGAVGRAVALLAAERHSRVSECAALRSLARLSVRTLPCVCVSLVGGLYYQFTIRGP